MFLRIPIIFNDDLGAAETNYIANETTNSPAYLKIKERNLDQWLTAFSGANETEKNDEIPNALNFTISDAMTEIVKELYSDVFGVDTEFPEQQYVTPNRVLTFITENVKVYDDQLAFDIESGDGWSLREIRDEMPISQVGPYNITAPVFDADPGKSTPNIYDFSTIALFRGILENRLNFTYVVDNDEAIAAYLGHNLAHAIADHEMMDRSKSNEFAKQTAYCTGYNVDNCLFRLTDSGNTADKELLEKIRTSGVTWCEAHQAIILNALLRKVK
jgi:hypothetical protein